MGTYKVGMVAWGWGSRPSAVLSMGTWGRKCQFSTSRIIGESPLIAHTFICKADYSLLQLRRRDWLTLTPTTSVSLHWVGRQPKALCVYSLCMCVLSLCTCASVCVCVCVWIVTFIVLCKEYTSTVLWILYLNWKIHYCIITMNDSVLF